MIKKKQLPKIQMKVKQNISHESILVSNPISEINSHDKSNIDL